MSKMMNKRIMLGILTAASLSFGANATIIFQDNFDTESGGKNASTQSGGNSASLLNYTGFSNWMASDGTVDVVANGDWDIQCAGASGKCIDLDGSTYNAGVLASNPIFLTAGNYTLSFDISGNQRSGLDAMVMGMGGFLNEEFDLSSTDDWRTITREFTVTSDATSFISFDNAGGDRIGIMLDNVILSFESAASVSEPASLSLIGLGLIGLVFTRRKYRA
jgi:hypothetical protein